MLERRSRWMATSLVIALGFLGAALLMGQSTATLSVYEVNGRICPAGTSMQRVKYCANSAGAFSSFGTECFSQLPERWSGYLCLPD